MIKLENISTMELLGDNSKEGQLELSKEAQQIIREYGLTDYDKLQRFITKNGGEVFGSDLMEEISFLERYVKGNNPYVEPEIYPLKDLISPLEIITNRDLIDQNNRTSDLLFESPLVYGTEEESVKRIGYYKKTTAMPYTIYELKQLLTHCDKDGVSCYKDTIYDLDMDPDQKRKMCNGDIPDILAIINLYEEQLLRQYEENKESVMPSNAARLFSFNKIKKMSMLEEQYADIAKFLYENHSYLWKEFSLKEALAIEASLRGRTQDDLEIRRRLIDAISNYTTVSEIKNGVVRSRAMDRFIK